MAIYLAKKFKCVGAKLSKGILDLVSLVANGFLRIFTLAFLLFLAFQGALTLRGNHLHYLT